MASRNVPFIIHPARGGLDSTKAATLLGPEELTEALNIEYDTSGARRKRLGTNRYNATAITDAPTVTALEDYWRYNSADGTWTQKFVATAGTQIWRDDLDGVWDSIGTGWGSNTAAVNIILAENVAVFCNDINDAPQTWNQTTLAALGGTPPNFALGVYHQRRLFVAGTRLTPSRVDVSAAGAIATWSGADATNLIFDEDDSDRIMGLSKPFRSRIYVFKGPHKGSIHEITGTTISGTGAYARNRIFSGIPCVSSRSVVTTPNDIFWASKYGIHSLTATDKYGDTEEAFLSRPIQADYRLLSQTDARLSQIVGFYHPTRNVVGWLVPAAGASQNTTAFVYNLALKLWATYTYTGFNGASAQILLTPSTAVPRLYIGGYDGFVRAADQTTLTDDNGSAYTARIRTPVYVKFGDVAHELQEKQFYSITTFFRPKGNYNATLTVNVDRRSQTANVNMAGGADTLG